MAQKLTSSSRSGHFFKKRGLESKMVGIIGTSNVENLVVIKNGCKIDSEASCSTFSSKKSLLSSLKFSFKWKNTTIQVLQPNVSLFLNLPDVVILSICEYLEEDECSKLMFTCKRLKLLLESENWYWRHLVFGKNRDLVEPNMPDLLRAFVGMVL